MAIYHLNLKTIGRSDGRSATGAAAYRAGCRLADRRTGLGFDYTRKRGCDGAEILAPAEAPPWATDRDELWNRVEAGEKRKDAQLAREVEFALPIELDPEAMQQCARAFVREQFVAVGMVADLAFHHLTGKNPHAHCLLTLRPLTPDGFGPKERAWNDRTLCDEWRAAWARHANAALAQAGRAERIDHRPLPEQALTALDNGALATARALDRWPTVHEARDVGAIAHNVQIRAANLTRADEWAAIEAQALAEARLMAAHTDARPEAAATAATAVPVVPAAPAGRPAAARPVDAEAQLRLAMAEARGLAAAGWRAADQDVTALRERLRSMEGEQARRIRARDRAERAEAAAIAERGAFLAQHPQPRGWWIFNRTARAEWAARLARRDERARKARDARARAFDAADLPALLRLEQERAAVANALARALAQRRRHGCLPSENRPNELDGATTEPAPIGPHVPALPSSPASRARRAGPQ